MQWLNVWSWEVGSVLRCLKFEAPEWINALATTGGQMAQWLGVFRPVLVQERGATQVETALRNRIITQYNMTMYTYLILYNILYI